MTTWTLGLDAVRSVVVLAFVAVALAALRRSSASVRRLVLFVAFAALLALPIVSRAGSAIGWSGALPPPATGAFAEPLVADPAALPVAAQEGTAAPAGAMPSGADAGPVALVVRAVSVGLPLAWALGAVVLLARVLASRLALRRAVRRAEPVRSPAAACALDAARRAHGVDATVLSSCDVDVPAVAGVVRPVVLVPPGSDAWDEERWLHVLTHELAHVRQRDALALICAQVACALYWFNPLVWWARRRLEVEREAAADERVLAAGVLPSAYALTLLSVATEAWAPDALVASGSVAAARGEGVASRVEAIVSGRTGRPLAARSAWLVAAAVAGGALIPGCIGGATESSTPEPEHGPSDAAQSTTGSKSLAEEVAAAVGAAPSEVALTIDPRVQAIVDEEIARLNSEWSPEAATAIVVDPATGDVVALSGVELAKTSREPGSTFKLLTVGAALERAAVTPETRFDCGSGSRVYGDRKLTDAGSYGELDVRDIVATSSNVGASRVFDKLGTDLSSWLERSGMTGPSSIELRGLEAPVFRGPLDQGTFEGALVSMGHGIRVSPLHLTALYGAIANGGSLPRLSLVRSVRGEERGRSAARLFGEGTARSLRGMLEHAVYGERATGKNAQVGGFRVGGKTGTAELEGEGERSYASFVGLAPIDAPRYVVFVGALAPKGGATGGQVAAPAFARIVARALGT
jgi:beta-lactamase regulating signal transducer with metallopeptidase domain